MWHVSLHDTIDTTSHTPAHTQLLEHTPPYNTADPRVDGHSHLISSYNEITQSIIPNFWSNSLCPRCRGSSTPGSIISSHPILMLLEPEPLLPINSIWMSLLTWDLAWWLLWHSGACSPHHPKALGIRPTACGSHGPCLPPCWGGGLAPALVLGFGLRLWYTALPSMVLSVYKSFLFSFSCINKQLRFFILSLLLSTFARGAAECW